MSAVEQYMSAVAVALLAVEQHKSAAKQAVYLQAVRQAVLQLSVL